ncbi:WhiB family transcriptional regulator [Streptomyces sp. NPDC087850]|uniref:WhiB family transcriptional regulator n=1 Tax=Streptomyces sp. NPDC087850 TaxID=3365809 RepID=UPI003813E4E3
MSGALWRADALCAQTDPELFYPEPGGSHAVAKRVCMACPVRRECLNYAIDSGQTWGIWGGLSQEGLRRLVRTRGRTRAA